MKLRCIRHRTMYGHGYGRWDYSFTYFEPKEFIELKVESEDWSEQFRKIEYYSVSRPPFSELARAIQRALRMATIKLIEVNDLMNMWIKRREA